MSLNYIKQHNIEIRGFIEKSFTYARELSEQPLGERSCPVCGSGGHSTFAVCNGLRYVRCSDCTLLYMNPTVTPDTIMEGFKGDDELVMEYFNIMNRYKRGIPEKPDPMLDPKMVDIYRQKQSGRLLDVGCAFGEFLHKAKHFYEVEGVEINPYTAPIAARYFTVHTKFLSELQLPPVYDIVVLHEVLYGAPDPVALLKDVSKVLKDNGILYIHTGNSASYATEVFGEKINHLTVYTMQNVFTPQALGELAKRSGFRIRTLRTEWLDIYLTDLKPFLDGDPRFIHKRNIFIPEYEEKLKAEDEFHCSLNQELGDRGNYLIAVLEKINN
jgi:SAM-dependent methyltransferase